MFAELIRTDDAVLVSYVAALLRDRGIQPTILDWNVSQLHGAVGWQPQRILVDDDDWAAARLFLIEAGLGAWISERPHD